MLPKNVFVSLKFQAMLRIATAAYVVVYLISSHHHAASTDSLGLPTHFDKLIHFSVYFVMSCLLMASSDNRHPKTERRSVAGFSGLTLAVLVTIGISLLDEFSQPWFGRHFDWLDLAFDWAGIVAGVVAYQSACLTWHLWLPSSWAANNSVD